MIYITRDVDLRGSSEPGYHSRIQPKIHLTEKNHHEKSKQLFNRINPFADRI